MSSWNANPWSNFCDPHWELISHNKLHPGSLEISTPSEIIVGTQVFLPADGEASWSLLQSLVSLKQPEHMYSCIVIDKHKDKLLCIIAGEHAQFLIFLA